MGIPGKYPRFLLIVLVLATTSACGTLLVPRSSLTTSSAQATAQESPPIPEPQIVKIPIIVTPTSSRPVPKGARIVIADIKGDCAAEVKDALMRRLIDNADYDVLTRDNLRQIIAETDETWAGKFNTTTAAKLGQLMGASLWIVGRVAYCDQSSSQTLENDFSTTFEEPDPRFDDEFASQFSIFAVLQIIDLETGKVLVSSASEGRYIPRPIEVLGLEETKPALTQPKEKETEKGAESSAPGKSTEDKAGPTAPPEAMNELMAAASVPEESRTGFLASMAAKTAKLMSAIGLGDEQVPTRTVRRADGREVTVRPEPKRYAVMRAADDMANGFADKFFARSLWDEVEMWKNPRRRYSEAIRLVKLGQCPEAVELIANDASRELPELNEREVAEYLHNYGVALLCANQLDLAAQKLRSAFRIQNDQASLKMLGLAAKIKEWDLVVETDSQPEIRLLVPPEDLAAGR